MQPELAVHGSDLPQLDAGEREDQRIIGLFWDRDERAIADCAARYGPYLMTVARNLLPTEEDAEECVSETYWRAWNLIPPKRPDALRLFLARLTRTAAVDLLRNLRARKRIPAYLTEPYDELAEIVSGSPGPEDEAEGRRLSRAINAYLAGLSSDARIIFVLRYFYGEDMKTIASRLGCTSSKVRSALFRARTGLKTYLEQEEFDL